MYPSGELKELAARKASLRVRIDERRWLCVENGAELVRPVVIVDDLVDRWRRIAPLAKLVGVPLGLMIVRRLVRKFRHVAGFAQMLPVIFQTARTVSQWRREGAM